MTPSDFQFIAKLLKEKSGFDLTPDQIYLLESRLGPIIRQNNLLSLEDLITVLKLGKSDLRDAVIEAVSINNTRFFRNADVFAVIKEHLSKNQRRPSIRVLSAGCAGGQEPVSVAIGLQEMKFLQETTIDIYALDMSKDSIARAKTGTYTHYEVQKGLPIRFLLKYFKPAKNCCWTLIEKVRTTIHYQTFNIMDVFGQKDFDIILCRNMLSFMTESAQKKVLKNLRDVIDEDGLLIVGREEKLHANEFFERTQPGCYAPKVLKRMVLPTNKKLFQ